MFTLKHSPRELAPNLLPLQTSLPSTGQRARMLCCNRRYWACLPWVQRERVKWLFSMAKSSKSTVVNVTQVCH